MSKKNPAVRNGNLELLRLLSMLLIVSYHYVIWGFFEEEMLFSSNKLFVDLMCLYSWGGMLLFVLISGYFMVDGRFTVRKLLTLMGMIWFYTLGALLFFLLFARARVGRKDLLDAVFPLLRQHYWYMTYYTALVFCSPFLNRLIRALDRRQLALLCLLSLLLCTGIPGIVDGLAGTTMVVFIALYFCAAYVKLHMSGDKRVGNRCLLLAAVLALACAALVVWRDVSWQRSGNAEGLQQSILFACGLNKPTPLLLSLLTFCGLACRPARSGGPAARLGPLTVGVYLFQSNGLISLALWQDVLHTRSFTDSPLLPLHAAGSLLLIFAAAMTVEALRRRFVAPVWGRLVDRIAPSLERVLDRIWDRAYSLGKTFLRDE